MLRLKDGRIFIKENTFVLVTDEYSHRVELWDHLAYLNFGTTATEDHLFKPTDKLTSLMLHPVKGKLTLILNSDKVYVEYWSYDEAFDVWVEPLNEQEVLNLIARTPIGDEKISRSRNFRRLKKEQEKEDEVYSQRKARQ